jgi:hypothetical protein
MTAHALCSHRGGQGFKSPQLHVFPQVRGSPSAPRDLVKIVCHSDVTGISQQRVTLGRLRRIARQSADRDPLWRLNACRPGSSDDGGGALVGRPPFRRDGQAGSAAVARVGTGQGSADARLVTGRRWIR